MKGEICQEDLVWGMQRGQDPEVSDLLPIHVGHDLEVGCISVVRNTDYAWQ